MSQDYRGLILLRTLGQQDSLMTTLFLSSLSGSWGQTLVQKSAYKNIHSRLLLSTFHSLYIGHDTHIHSLSYTHFLSSSSLTVYRYNGTHAPSLYKKLNRNITLVHRSGIQITALKFTLFPFPLVMCRASVAALLCAQYESPSLCHSWVTC